ncbi:lysine biosynthesis protein LysX [Pendulispora albinea]|uniref:Lysine biosynthesis protein LysX n=1 Tax=Pendulispora albinea TaxID=2741071 RepID=A0ABZ2LRA7_9BACT
MAVRRFAVAASRVRFEEKQLFEALQRRGASCDHLDPRSFWAGDGATVPRYAAVLNREIAQVRGLYLTHLLEAADVTVVNSAHASELCADKARTTAVLRAHRIPTPKTAVALSGEAARKAAVELGYPLVMKPVTGSWGRMVNLLRDPDALEAVLEHREAMPSPQHRIMYLQEFVPKPGRDIRIIVARREPVGAMYRISADWRTNTARGARTEPCPLRADLVELAVRAADAVGARIAGVDVVEDAGGALQVLEVNHVVEFHGLMEAHGGQLDVAGAMADALISAGASC